MVVATNNKTIKSWIWCRDCRGSPKPSKQGRLGTPKQGPAESADLSRLNGMQWPAMGLRGWARAMPMRCCVVAAHALVSGLSTGPKLIFEAVQEEKIA